MQRATRPPHIQQRVLAGQQPGETHARACLLDHAAELQTMLAEITDGTITIDVAPVALHEATRAWATAASHDD